MAENGFDMLFVASDISPVGGGFAPLVFASLYMTYQSSTTLSLYIGAGLPVTLASQLAAKETAHKPLEH